LIDIFKLEEESTKTIHDGVIYCFYNICSKLQDLLVEVEPQVKTLNGSKFSIRYSEELDELN